ncbi:MAG TPA: c-type cytochrome [Rhizomicrobium sp.]|jgi:cytochrome c|nr:c-type cytochrome [Rhizomicrobium sp.]
MFAKSFIMLALLAGTVSAAQADGDAIKGKEVFKRCAVCHTDARGGGNGLGPNLFGVVGRKAASLPNFSYSGPLKNSHLVWTEANLTRWVAGPGRVVPGTKMAFPGITSTRQQADVVAYLKTLK